MKKTFAALLLSLLSAGAFAQHADVPEQKPKEIFRFVEQQPEPGYDLMAYVAKHMKYPEEAKDAGIQGRVIVTFIITTDGSISNAEIVKGNELGHGLPEEAKRVVMSFPKWKPGKQNGQAVNVYFTMPLTFKLQ